MTDTNKKVSWEDRYETGNLPWDTGRYDRNLEAIIKEHSITPGRALELGCGTGTNALWLAEQGFDVTAVDISGKALAAARGKASSAQIDVEFIEIDIHEQILPGGPYEFVFDRGCFHSSQTEEQRDLFVRRVYNALAPGGLWLSFIGSTDAPPRTEGPPQLSALQIATHIEPLFEITSLTATHFDSQHETPPPAWACLARRRKT